MVIGVMTAQLHLQGIHSLKQKRSVVKRLIERLRNRYNVSVSEVDQQDSKVRALIGISVISNQRQFVEKQFDTILNFIRADTRYILGQTEREIFN